MGKHNKVTGQNGQAGPISRAINFLAFNSKSVSQIGLNFVAAGILGPSLYGEVAIVLAIYAVTTFLLEQGWTVGILSGSVERAEFARQVRRSTVRVGIFSLSALALCSAVGNLYSSRIVAYCIAILAIAVPLRVASIVLTSVALACGRIHTVSASELCGASVGFGVGVAIAGLLHNGIAVIIGYLIIDLILAFAMGIFVWRAKLLDEMTATSAGKGRSFQSRSQSSFRGQLAGAVHRNADNLFFPHFFSPALFGAYAIAYRVMMLGVGNIAPALTRIELAQARIRSDETRPGDIVRALILVVAITTPLMAGLAAFGASAVQAVLGQGWSDLETLLPPLAVAGAAQAPLSFLGSACIALGQLRLQTTIAYTQTCVFLALIFAAPAIGLRTFTYLYAGASVLVLIAALIALFHRQEMRITAVATPLVGIAFLSGVVYGISRLAGNSLAGIAVGVMITCAAVVSGLLAVRRWHPGQLQAVKS